MVKPWTCMATGACCRKVDAVVLTASELDAVLAHPDRTASLDVTERGDGFVSFAAGPCPLLTAEGKCSVYSARPVNCRRWMCGRTHPDEPLDLAPIPLKVLQNRDLRRQYALNQRRAMSKWGHAHGWTDRAV